MIPRKQYEPKPVAHSARDLEVIGNATAYLIRVTGRPEAVTSDPGQALAALLSAKANGIKCLVYARGEVLGEDTVALMDEASLRTKLDQRPKREEMSRAQVLSEQLFSPEYFDEKSLTAARNVVLSTFLADSPGEVVELALGAELLVKQLDLAKKGIKKWLKYNKREIAKAREKR